VAPAKLLPLMVTIVPTGPLAGVMLVNLGALTTVTLTAAEMAAFPAASRATAVRVCAPLLVVVSHVTEYGALVLAGPMGMPSTRNWTTTTPTSSVALAETVTVPETMEPAAGAVIDTVGGAVSDAGLFTV